MHISWVIFQGADGVLWKKVFFKKISEFKGKNSPFSLSFLIKSHDVQKRLQHRSFSVNLGKSLRTAMFCTTSAQISFGVVKFETTFRSPLLNESIFLFICLHKKIKKYGIFLSAHPPPAIITSSKVTRTKHISNYCLMAITVWDRV